MQHLLIISVILTETLSLRVPVNWNEENSKIILSETQNPKTDIFWRGLPYQSENIHVLNAVADFSQSKTGSDARIEEIRSNSGHLTIPFYSTPIPTSRYVQPKTSSSATEGEYQQTRFSPEKVLHKSNYLKKLQNQPQKILQAIRHSYFPLPVDSVSPITATKSPIKFEDRRKLNYRDDTLHEPLPYDALKESSDTEDKEALKEFNDDDVKEINNANIGNEENLPTHPIYPGPGVWAKKNNSYKKYVPPKPLIEGGYQENSQPRNTEKPDGHEIFEELKQFFDNQHGKFDQSFRKVSNVVENENTPIRISKSPDVQLSTSPNIIYDPFDGQKQITQPNQGVPRNNDGTKNMHKTEEEFVPTRLYTQVRKSNNEEHLSPDPAEHGRLKEVVKDSVIRTVYSEEGYEDSGYDHAGHEKKAEQDDGFAKYEKDVKTKKQNIPLHNSPELVFAQPKVYSSKFKNDNFDKNKLKHNKLKFSDEKDAESAESGNADHKIKLSMKSYTNSEGKKPSLLTHVKGKESGKPQGKTQEMEVLSEVKLFLQPNNVTKKQKIVKIYPRLHTNADKEKHYQNRSDTKKSISITKPLQSFTQHGNIQDKKILSTTSKPMKVTEILTEEHKNQMDEKPEGFKIIRKRRFTDNIKIDTDFIDNINHTLPLIKKNSKYQEKKYPYYSSHILPENSALRYGENLHRIPKKHVGEMSFYSQTEQIPCPVIETNLDPIPDRIKNARESNDEDEKFDKENSGEIQKTLRLKNLGDKIDCLKIKYFGKNPLDSPLFKEENIAAPKSIFPKLIKPPQEKAQRESSNIAQHIITNTTTTEKNIPRTTEFNSLVAKELTITEIFGMATTLKPNNTSQLIINSSVATLITTPKYTIDFKPKNIYDQIKLLKYLPASDSFGEQNMENVKLLHISKTEFEQDGRNLKKNKDDNILPYPMQLKKRRKLIVTPKPSLATDYEIFDITKYWPAHRHIITQASTGLPKYKSISEVFYKDEIKPNEQLNVFADVLNNIKNSSGQEKTNFDQMSVKLNSLPSDALNKNKIRKYHDNASKYINSFDGERHNILPVHDGYEVRNSVKYIEQHHNLKNKTVEPKDRNEKLKVLDSTELAELPTPTVAVDEIAEPNLTLGLVPPAKVNQKYRTIIMPFVHILHPVTVTEHFRPSLASTEESISGYPAYPDKFHDITINKFFYAGMKPPRKQNTTIFSDFLKVKDDNQKTDYTKRRKRDTFRRNYADLARQREEQNNGSIESTDSLVDDYIPRRNRSWHYDERSGKIVYDRHNPKHEGEEEVEYIEIEDIPATYAPGKVKENQVQSTIIPLLATATPPPKGEGFIDFVVQLKNSAQYKFIPDVTTTEKCQEYSETIKLPEAVTASSLKVESTTPPEFLNILSKVKNDNNYKAILDPDDPKINNSTITSRLAPLDPDVKDVTQENDEATIKNIHEQNMNLSKLQIFDIGEFLPKIKEYMPKTSINYSKYKSIERPKSNPLEQHDNDNEFSPESTKHEEIKLRQPTTLAGPVSTIINKAPLHITTAHNLQTEESTTSASISMYSETQLPTPRNSRRKSKQSNIQTTEQPIKNLGESNTNDKAMRKQLRRGSRSRRENPRINTTKNPPKLIIRMLLNRFSEAGTENDSMVTNGPEFKKSNADVVNLIVPSKRHTSIAEENLASNAKIQEIKQTNYRRHTPFKNLSGVVDDVGVAKIVFLQNSELSNYTMDEGNPNKVEVFKKYNPKNKHGGNYYNEEEFLEKDILKPPESQAEDTIELSKVANVSNLNQNKNVEIISQFNTKKIHGGNYKPEKEFIEKDTLSPESSSQVFENIKKVVQKYGNQRFVRIAPTDKYKQSTDPYNLIHAKISNISNKRITSLHDTNKKELVLLNSTPTQENRLGNHKTDGLITQQTFSTLKPAPLLKNAKMVMQKPEKVRLSKVVAKYKHNKKHSAPLLVDVVRKPEDFYSDPHLPKEVNRMFDVNKHELILENYDTSNTDINKNKHLKNMEQINRNINTDRSKSFSKNPVIIKDPSKRLYYYAPI